MGMFTSIIHPKDGRELQIKTGYDDCRTYKLGDFVDYHIDKDIFGYGGIFDGVYDSYNKKGIDDWVIINNHKVVAVRSKKYKYDTLIKQYKIKQPSRKLWTNEAWEKHKQQQQKFKKENDEFMKSIKHLSPQERNGRIMARPLIHRLFEESFARKCLKVEKLDFNL